LQQQGLRNYLLNTLSLLAVAVAVAMLEVLVVLVVVVVVVIAHQLLAKVLVAVEVQKHFFNQF
jgi:hypothetical protein